jgi:ABC-type transporter Mla MlaB component
VNHPIWRRNVADPGGPSPIVLTLGGPIAPADVPRLCEQLSTLLRQDGYADSVTLDVGALTDPDVVTIDALARMQLTARRLGRRIRLRHAGGGLRRLLASAGLSDVLPLCPVTETDTDRDRDRDAPLRLDPGGQPEQREQPRGVEE